MLGYKDKRPSKWAIKARKMWKNNKRLGPICIFIFVVLLLQIWLFRKQDTSFVGKQKVQVVENENEDWATFVHFGAAYLVRVVNTNGRFDYVVNHPDDRPASPRKYNVLRHAGAIYSLTKYYDWLETVPDHQEQTRNDVKYVAGLAVRYLCDKFIKPVEGHSDLFAAWDIPELIGATLRKQEVAKLGGAGLSLVALTSFEKIQPGFTPQATLQALARFILFLQKPDGSFYSKFTNKNGPDASWTSLFYPGEAALGLVLLYEIDGNMEWLHGAMKSLKYLARVRQTRTNVEPDHWAMIATEKIVRHRNAFPDTVYTDKVHDDLIFHVLQVVQQLAAIKWHQDEHSFSFPKDLRTTPAATRLEGMMAVLDIVKDASSVVYDSIVRKSYKVVLFLVRSQILTQDKRHGGIPLAIWLDDDGKLKNMEVRIDYNQHAICGVMEAIDRQLAQRMELMNK